MIFLFLIQLYSNHSESGRGVSIDSSAHLSSLGQIYLSCSLVLFYRSDRSSIAEARFFLLSPIFPSSVNLQSSKSSNPSPSYLAWPTGNITSFESSSFPFLRVSLTDVGIPSGYFESQVGPPCSNSTFCMISLVLGSNIAAAVQSSGVKNSYFQIQIWSESCRIFYFFFSALARMRLTKVRKTY